MNRFISAGILMTLISLAISNCHVQKEEFIMDDFPEVNVDTVQVDIEKKINESSGLAKVNNYLWTHNDSGGDPVIYEIDPMSGKENRNFSIKNTTNNDWEEIARDSSHLYIGNFGNNIGRRKNLQIYKVLIAGIEHEGDEILETIKFHYPEQQEFPGNYNHNFDAEAMITFGDSLYIFTKNWQNGECSIYALPKEEGDYGARLISTFDTKGTITGATFNPTTNEVILLGYNLNRSRNDFHPFVWVLSAYNGSDFFSGQQARYNLNIVRQAEAITWDHENRYYFSAENENGGNASLFSITIPR